MTESQAVSVPVYQEYMNPLLKALRSQGQPHWEAALLVDDGVAARLLADAHMMVGSYERALPVLTKLIPDRPQDAESRFLAGVCCLRLGRLGEAVLHYKDALRIAPGHRTARDDLKHAELALRASRVFKNKGGSKAHKGAARSRRTAERSIKVRKKRP